METLKTLDVIAQTKKGKFILLILSIFSFALFVAFIGMIYAFAGNWFLDLSIIEFATIVIFVSMMLFTILAGKTILLSILMATIIALYAGNVIEKRQVEFYSSINHKYYFTLDRWVNNVFMFSASLKGEYHSYDFDVVTLGESWCYFRDYQGSTCENYIIYVENKKDVLSEKWEMKRTNDTARHYQSIFQAESQKTKNNEILQRYENIVSKHQRSVK